MKFLILAGGESTRMGTPKSLLQFENGQSLLMHILEISISTWNCSADDLFVSFRDTDQAAPFQDVLSGFARILLDSDALLPGLQNIGPAAGLLRALDTDAEACWLVIACDYPLMTISALTYLKEQFEYPVTCFKNSYGKCEPLLSIWSPDALKYLKENVCLGLCSPSKAILELKGKLIDPLEETWLLNANTREEWERALLLAKTK